MVTKRSRTSKKVKVPRGESSEPRAPRALWSGTINLGLIAIPVRLVTALKDTGVHFHRVTANGKCRLRQKLYCPDTGQEYDFSETARGYEVAPNQYVIVNEEELAALRPEGGHSLEILQFVELSEIDPIYFDRPYYFLPGKNGEKPYELLRQVLEQSGKAALGKLSIHEKEYAGIILSDHNALRIQTLHFFDQIVQSTSVVNESPAVKISKQEVSLAEDLVQSLTKPFHPEQFMDESSKEMKKLLETKSKGKIIHVEPTEAESKGGQVVDLMSRLKASLAQQKQRGTEKTKVRAGTKR